jgi:hypothetical protein
VTTGVVVRLAGVPVQIGCAAPSHTLVSSDDSPPSRPMAPPDPPPRG